MAWSNPDGSGHWERAALTWRAAMLLESEESSELISASIFVGTSTTCADRLLSSTSPRTPCHLVVERRETPSMTQGGERSGQHRKQRGHRVSTGAAYRLLARAMQKARLAAEATATSTADAHRRSLITRVTSSATKPGSRRSG